jgi:hypothetical protein
MSDKGSNSALLTKALKDLIIQWERTGGAWRDRARVDFDKEYVQEFIPAVRAASNAAQQIEILLDKVRLESS